jgi:hypothetical protein
MRLLFQGRILTWFQSLRLICFATQLSLFWFILEGFGMETFDILLWMVGLGL